MKKILVAIDRSERDRSVFEAALSLAQTTGGTLMLLQVLSEKEAGYPILPTYAYYPIADDRNYDIYRERLAEYKQWGIDLLRELTETAAAAGVRAEYTQLAGNPGRTICEIAANWSADLIVLGSRGLKGLKEMILGSVSNYVTHHAPCSVLIVRSEIANAENLDAMAMEEESSIDNRPLTTNEK